MSMLGALLPLLASVLVTPDVDGPFLMRLNGGFGSVVMIELFVAPDRTIEACRVVYSNYTEAGNRRICQQARRGKASVVARDVDGNPVHGFVTVGRIARVAGSRPSESPSILEPAYLEVGVEDLPGRDVRKAVHVAVLADAEGTVSHCEGQSQSEPAFARIACQQLAGHRLPVMHDRTGAAVPYVKALRVDFVEEPAGS